MTDFEVDAFFAIVQTGSITKAAASLGITQSALSRRLVSLEESLGYPLLVHQKGVRNVQLTELGREFFGIAQKWKLLWKEAQALATTRISETIKAAATDSIHSYIMPLVYRAFMKENPDTNLVGRTYHSRESFSMVEGGLIDIALIASAPRFNALVATEQLYAEPLLCVANKSAGYQDGINPSSLDPAREVRFIKTEDFLTWHSNWFPDERPVRISLDKYIFDSKFPFAEDNWGFVPASIAYHLCQVYDVSVVDIQNGPPNRFIYYITQNRPQPDVVKKFIECLKNQVRNVPGITPL